MTNTNDLLANGLNALLDKQPELLKAQAYYDGTMTEIYASAAIKKALKQSGTWSLNYCAIPVAAVASRLQLLKLSSDASRASKLLEQVALRNNLQILISEIITNTLKYGHSYASVTLTKGKPEIYALSPLTTHIAYELERPRVAEYAVRLWATDNGYRANLYTDTHIYRYETNKLPQTVKPDTFTLIGTSANPYGIPIFEFTTGPDKQPEHAPGYAAQDALTKSYTAQLAAIDFASFPVRVALSDAEQANDFSDEQAAEALSAHPGQITLMQGFKSVAQLQPMPPSQYTEPINHLIRQLAMLTQTPLTHFADWQKSNVSGEGTRATENAFYRKCRDRQAYLTVGLTQLFEFVLELKQITGNVTLEWANVETSDKTETWAWRYKAVQSGLPVEQMLLEAGYEQSEIDAWRAAGTLPVFNAQTNAVELGETNE